MFVVISGAVENSFCLSPNTMGSQKPCTSLHISSWSVEIPLHGYCCIWKSWNRSSFYLVVMMQQPFLDLDFIEWDSSRQPSWSLEESLCKGFLYYKRYCCWYTQHPSNRRRSEGKNKQKTYNLVDTLPFFSPWYR